MQVTPVNAQLGLSSGLVIVATFLIPPSNQHPILSYQIAPGDPVSFVPDSMFIQVGRYFVVTFTDTSAVTVADLSGTVFTITDFTNVSLALITLSSPTQNAAVGNDVLGDLLSSTESAGGGQMIGAVAPTSVSQAAIPPVSSGEPSRDGAEPTRTWIRIMENLFRGVQQLFGPQLHLGLDGLLVPLAEPMSAPSDTATPLAEPAVEIQTPLREPSAPVHMTR